MISRSLNPTSSQANVGAADPPHGLSAMTGNAHQGKHVSRKYLLVRMPIHILG